MKSLKSLLYESIPNDELSVNLQKVVKIVKMRKIGTVVSSTVAAFSMIINAFYVFFFFCYHTNSEVIVSIHTAFAAKLSVLLNNFLADFFTKFELRCVALAVVSVIIIPFILSTLILLLFTVISNSYYDKDVKSSFKSLRDGFLAVDKEIKHSYVYYNSIVGYIYPPIFGLAFFILLFRNELAAYFSEEPISEVLKFFFGLLIILCIFGIVCKLLLSLITIPVKKYKIVAGINQYDFDKLWVQKDPVEKKNREEAEKRRLEEKRKYCATHAKIKVHFRCSRSDYRAIVKDNGTYLFDLKPGQTKTADVPVGEHYITSQVVDDYEGGRGNVNGGSVYLGPGEIQELEVTA